MHSFARRFSVFMNWFDGLCAPICGAWMMLSGLGVMPANLDWTGWMPLSIYDNMPLHDVFFTSHFWPGLALLLVNGVANVIALTHRSTNEHAWTTWCLVAGLMLVAWTIVEMVFLPNPMSAIYLVLGLLQTACALKLKKGQDSAH